MSAGSYPEPFGEAKKKKMFWNCHFSKRWNSHHYPNSEEIISHLPPCSPTAHSGNVTVQFFHHSDHTPATAKVRWTGNFANTATVPFNFAALALHLSQKAELLPPDGGSAPPVPGWGRHPPGWAPPARGRPAPRAGSPSRGVRPVTIRNSNEKHLSNFHSWGNVSSGHWVQSCFPPSASYWGCI